MRKEERTGKTYKGSADSAAHFYITLKKDLHGNRSRICFFNVIYWKNVAHFLPGWIFLPWPWVRVSEIELEVSLAVAKSVKQRKEGQKRKEETWKEIKDQEKERLEGKVDREERLGANEINTY